MPELHDGNGSYLCDGCGKVYKHRRWTHGDKTYHSCECAEDDDWDAMEQQPYDPALYEKGEPREAIAMTPEKRPDWSDPLDGIGVNLPRTKA